jgi:hypothetical protein
MYKAEVAVCSGILKKQLSQGQGKQPVEILNVKPGGS